MQFVVIAYDYKDDKTLQRRLSVREEHLKFADKMHKEGKWIFASALLDDDGKMNGSIIFCEYPSEKIMREEWLKREVYIVAKVWETIIIRKVKVAKH